jgi:hypothetical protein
MTAMDRLVARREGDHYTVARTRQGSRRRLAVPHDVRMDRAVRRRALGVVAAVVLLGLLVFVARRDPPAVDPPGPTARPAPAALVTSSPGAFGRAVPIAPPPWNGTFSWGNASYAQVAVDQADGLFRVDGISATGMLFGGAGFDADPYRAPHRVGLVEADDDTVRWLRPGRGAAQGMVAGTDVVAWGERRGDGYDLQVMCARAADGWRPAQVSTAGARAGDQPLVADGETVAWTDDEGTAWASQMCGRPRRIGEGRVVAIAMPYAYLRQPGDDGRLDEVALEGPPRRVSRTVGVGDATRFAAFGDNLVWVDDGTVTHYDRRSGERREIEATLPDGSSPAGELVTLTVGRGIVTYVSRPVDGDPSLTRSLIYVLASGSWQHFGAEAYAAGDVFVWRERDRYWLARFP